MVYTDVNKLNEFLADKSYMEGYQPSQADVTQFKTLSGAPSADLCHALRWYNHIKSYEKEFGSLPGEPKNASAPVEDEDDDVDLFASDDEEEEDDEETKRIKEERLQAYNAKKQKKPALIAKSMIILDVKPWEDETDLVEMERLVRGVVADGLVWGASKLVPLAYGIRKLQISCVVEDDKIGTDFLEETITAFEDHVQSVDIAAFNKL
ncbi:PREDICTED: elongation factor 1-beta-like [Priapulus caudatus]|uniref:Elongation factor 1-beta-like n=1 Tax=Priapulus caudatus TaxID=37621 RepID=A0ABM1EFB8_PRICU|nr:PREDICTED: elongation factor 1-beta-like [Priapulus caudatus]